MKLLYLLLDLGVIIFPFLLSFDKRVAYVKSWGKASIALILIGIPFLIHDYYFTRMGIWGFNPDYLTGYYFFNLPIEEVLFFVVVPFACTFIYACCQYYTSSTSYRRFNLFFYGCIACYAVLLLYLGWGKWYSSMVASVCLVFVSLLGLNDSKYPHLPIAVVLSMLPFFLMNSILTGAFTANPIVWYNDHQNINFRWGTIPIEDVLYSFVLVAANILVFDYLKKRNA
ncbi:lycopene cyclase domain-containing protein [Aureispira anguillae]|uniref:Lycopene cyclase domain-containing protein n=1 Tax=Aureispira anguillae TaxID=2864201 RepID=A0A915YIM5_9BACT|nr:lycopene cyclase domain-containing protein [Aureispira anguillae]BDS13859.1 lycopene cyclase domain-containing protein [Aureispira anguillae]